MDDDSSANNDDRQLKPRGETPAHNALRAMLENFPRKQYQGEWGMGPLSEEYVVIKLSPGLGDEEVRQASIAVSAALEQYTGGNYKATRNLVSTINIPVAGLQALLAQDDSTAPLATCEALDNIVQLNAKVMKYTKFLEGLVFSTPREIVDFAVRRATMAENNITRYPREGENEIPIYNLRRPANIDGKLAKMTSPLNNLAKTLNETVGESLFHSSVGDSNLWVQIPEHSMERLIELIEKDSHIRDKLHEILLAPEQACQDKGGWRVRATGFLGKPVHVPRDEEGFGGGFSEIASPGTDTLAASPIAMIDAGIVGAAVQRIQGLPITISDSPGVPTSPTQTSGATAGMTHQEAITNITGASKMEDASITPSGGLFAGIPPISVETRRQMDESGALARRDAKSTVKAQWSK